MSIGERVTYGRGPHEARCLTCAYWEPEISEENPIAAERAVVLRYGEFAGLAGRCELRDCGAISRAWCDEWNDKWS